MKAVEKIKGWYKKHDVEVKAIASLVAIYTYGAAIGYIAGTKVYAGRFGAGLNIMFEETPGLEEQFAEALHKARVARLKES